MNIKLRHLIRNTRGLNIPKGRKYDAQRFNLRNSVIAFTLSFMEFTCGEKLRNIKELTFKKSADKTRK